MTVPPSTPVPRDMAVLRLADVNPVRWVARLADEPNRQFHTQSEAEDWIEDNGLVLSYENSPYASRWTLQATSVPRSQRRV